MDKIMNTLPDNHISNETLWTYKDNIEIFNKYNQQVIHSIKKPEMKLKSESESDPEIKLTLKSEPEPEMKKQKLSK